MKRVLITGANSYIGTSFEKYAYEYYSKEFSIDTIDMVDGTWREKDFSSYDIVYHVAGIAHADVGNVTEEVKKKYYAVNTDLAIETAKKAKKDGVKQFVFMSSAIIYGDSAPVGKRKRITKKTKPHPANFYGDSKWRADKGVRKLAEENFIVTVLRPPMIYGKGSKGNYPTLSKMAKKMPIFPDIKNERSMLYIENLCEFLCQIMIRGKGGIFWPQNAEYSKTSDLVKMIADANNHKILVSKAWNIGVKLATLIPGKPRGLANKAFGNMSYDQKMSKYDFKYQSVELRASVEKTERKKEGKKALQLASVASMIDQFNMPNIEILKSLGYEVDVVADFKKPGTITTKRAKDLIQRLNDMNVKVFDIHIPRSLNPIIVLSAYIKVKKIIETEGYDLIHCHSPIGGAICRLAAVSQRKRGTKIIYTAHGFHFFKGAPIKNWIIFYPIEKWLSKYTDVLITINKEDYRRAKKYFNAKNTVYIPGVGVDTKKFAPRQDRREKIRKELNLSDEQIMLLSVGELNENKNHISVIKAIKDTDYVYVIVGKGDKKLELESAAKECNVDLRLMGYRSDVADFYNAADVYVLPSLREGLNVSLMEAMASGLAVTCSDIRGNTDLIVDSTFDPKDTKGLAVALKNTLDNKEKLSERNIKMIKKNSVYQVNNNIKKVYQIAEFQMKG